MGNELSIVFDLGWKLLLVLILAFLSTRLLRWLSSPTLAPASVLTILARQPIGAQQTLLLVAVGKKRLLLGQTPRQITLLAEIAESDLPLPASYPRVKATTPVWLGFLPFASPGRDPKDPSQGESAQSTTDERADLDAFARLGKQPFTAWLRGAVELRCLTLSSAGSATETLAQPGSGATD